MNRDFYFFRHGETDYNVEKRLQGWKDIPLNETGIAQANELAKVLSNIQFDCIYSSPLLRALKTAEIVSVPHHTQVIVDQGLKEWNLGVFCGKIIRLTEDAADTPVDINTDIVYVPKALISNNDFVPQNGESYNMFAKRIHDTIFKIAQNTDAKTVGIATHSGIIRTLIQQFTNLKYPRSGTPNTGYIKMQGNGKTFTLPEIPDWLLNPDNSRVYGH